MYLVVGKDHGVRVLLQLLRNSQYREQFDADKGNLH
jgi:hypothetical protein